MPQPRGVPWDVVDVLRGVDAPPAAPQSEVSSMGCSAL